MKLATGRAQRSRQSSQASFPAPSPSFLLPLSWATLKSHGHSQPVRAPAYRVRSSHSRPSKQPWLDADNGQRRLSPQGPPSQASVTEGP